jgi:hypothetical protein
LNNARPISTPSTQDQRQIFGQLRGDAAAGELRIESVQRRADHFFERRPFLVHDDAAGLEARHVEQVANQSIQANRLLEDRLEQLFAERRRAVLAGEERGGRSRDRRQRRPEVVR